MKTFLIMLLLFSSGCGKLQDDELDLEREEEYKGSDFREKGVETD